ncbi:MAG: hypothetical protein ACKVU2_16490 [Saprospiraceae bacterium]
MKKFVFFLLLLSCNAPPESVSPAFFHWKNSLALTQIETDLLDELGCQTLYVKFLDIAKDPQTGNIRPYSLLEVRDTAGLTNRAIVPCIFITNSVFQGISEDKMNWLAGKTAEAIANTSNQFAAPASGKIRQLSEIQFDCDWTETTRVAFFSFIKKMRDRLPPKTRLSATIRLHQYKFPDRTGVPPADRGMLMLYNTGDIDDPDEPNSIFQRSTAEIYLHGAPPKYPLPLDVALPVFAWALVYRDGELWKIVPESGPPGIQNPEGTTSNINLPYMRPDDLVRYESVDTGLLREAATLAAGIRLAPDARVAFFHLAPSVVQRYPADFLKSIFTLGWPPK